MSQYHFISGLPRSGSTLLAALLRQNPDLSAGISSPVGGLFHAVHNAMGAWSETSVMLDDDQRRRVLQMQAKVGRRCRKQMGWMAPAHGI